MVSGDGVLGCIRFDQKDWINRSLRVSIDIKSEATLEAFIAHTKSILTSFIQYEGIDRFYIYILPMETLLKSVLTALEFQQEAVLEEHIYIQGKYENLEIWGTERQGS